MPKTDRVALRSKSLSTLLSILVVGIGLDSTAAVSQSNAQQSSPQQPPAKMLSAPQWETTTGGKMSFEVASVRQNKAGGTSSMNVDPTSGDFFTPTGGLYSARNIVLAQFVMFAYKLTNKQLQSFQAQFPWSMEVLYDIDARADGNPTKDQYRLMMQSLLGERFKLSAHFETREVPLYALALVMPGKLGPQLRLHRTDDPICTGSNAANLQSTRAGFAADAEGFPLACADVRMVPSAPGLYKSGGRNVPMARFASNITGVGEVDRPMVDETGIQGTVDYSLEWKQSGNNVGVDASDSGTTFDQALKEQLGFKMVPKRGPADFFVVAHIERPSEN